MDGFGLCAAIRAVREASGVPIIAISTSPPDYERALLDDRFAAVTMKPCLPEDLVRLVRALAGRDFPY
jgi:CheY-like chemotaxis protein